MSFPTPDDSLPARRRRIAEALLIALFLGQGIAAAIAASGTCDELASHIPSGILAWKSGRFSGGVANPPLGQLLVGSLPVALGNADHPLSDRPGLLIPARAPVLLLGILTILGVAAFARRIGGASASVAALSVAALCPNLVAHASLATLDLPSTAWGTLAALLAWNFARAPSVGRVIPYALAIGAAAETKATALHWIPSLALGALLLRAPWRARLRVAASLFGAGLAGFAAVHGALALAFPPAGVGGGLALEGLRTKWEQGRSGHFSYLLGQRSAQGFPHYYAVALLVKLPLPTLIFFVLGGLRLARDPSLRERRSLAAFVIVPALSILLAMSFVHRVHIGIRHILPAFPAILAIAGIGAAGLIRGGRAARMIAIALGVWLAVGTLARTPRPLAFFNELAGGTAGGERILIDSNLDWGQDERLLRAACAGREVSVNPSGPVEGLVAANVNAIHGILQRSDRRLGWVASLPPLERIGDTWRIVRADERTMREAGTRGPREALSLARWLTGTGRAEEAIDVLRANDLSRHAELAASWHDALAEAYLAAGDVAAAAEHVVPGVDGDLAVVIAYRLSESRATPWLTRDPRERARVFEALLARGAPQQAESLAVRVLAEIPDDADALRGLLFARLAIATADGRGEAAILPPGTMPLGPAFDLFEVAPKALEPHQRLLRAALLRKAGCEQQALAETGALLADDPANAVALELYGELVVRRKLGLTEYPMPDVDWSEVRGMRGVRDGEKTPDDAERAR